MPYKGFQITDLPDESDDDYAIEFQGGPWKFGMLVTKKALLEIGNFLTALASEHDDQLVTAETDYIAETHAGAAEAIEVTFKPDPGRPHRFTVPMYRDELTGAGQMMVETARNGTVALDEFGGKTASEIAEETQP